MNIQCTDRHINLPLLVLFCQDSLQAYFSEIKDFISNVSLVKAEKRRTLLELKEIKF